MYKVIQVTAAIVLILAGLAAIPARASGTEEPVPSENTEWRSRVRVVNRGHEGQELQIERYRVAGKINVFDFFSEYCGPCRRIAPLLEQLARLNTEVVVNKVDINRPGVSGIDGASPVVAQYHLDSIPHFVVYDASGKKVAEGEAARNYVTDLMRAAGVR